MVDDTVLEEHIEDPCLVQIRVIGHGGKLILFFQTSFDLREIFCKIELFGSRKLDFKCKFEIMQCNQFMPRSNSCFRTLKKEFDRRKV